MLTSSKQIKPNSISSFKNIFSHFHRTNSYIANISHTNRSQDMLPTSTVCHHLKNVKKVYGDKLLFEVFGIEEHASMREVKKRYRVLSLRHHPDRGGSLDHFQAMYAPYMVLSCPTLRKTYADIKNNWEEVYENMFGPNPPGTARGRRAREAEDDDVSIDLNDDEFFDNNFFRGSAQTDYTFVPFDSDSDDSDDSDNTGSGSAEDDLPVAQQYILILQDKNGRTRARRQSEG